LESLHENIRAMTFNNVVPFFEVRMNNRDHRKILVIDGKVAFTGGFNLADEYINVTSRYGYWKDSGLRIKGEAVASFTQMFFYTWNAFRADKEDIKNYLIRYTPTERTANNTPFRVQPYDDSPLDSISAGEAVYMDVINRAVRYAYIFTPYLILDDLLRAALCRAAMRGVDVRIVTPGIPDKKTVNRLTRANYAVLMKAGVKIYEYTPGFIHSKSILCDDEYAVVGTINFDYRSLYLHFENAVYFSGCSAVSDLKRDCEETFAVSKLCTEENTKRGIFGRLFDSVLRVFETLL
jgi:cardiolipin synthase